MINFFKRRKAAPPPAPPLKVGDHHYRAFVGPPDEYDLVAAMGFNLMTCLGLRQHHHLLDIGCGSLRIGRLLIPYLDPGHYAGIEPNRWLVKEGIQREVGRDQVRLKKPRFYFAGGPEILPAEPAFDFVLAQSVFSHSTLELIERWLRGLFPHLRADGALAATFKQGEQDFYHEKGIGKEDFQGGGWIYPKCPAYREQTIKALAQKTGYRFQVLDWAHPRQTWALFSREKFDGAWLAQKSLTWNDYLKSRRGGSRAKARE